MAICGMYVAHVLTDRVGRRGQRQEGVLTDVSAHRAETSQ